MEIEVPIRLTQRERVDYFMDELPEYHAMFRVALNMSLDTTATELRQALSAASFVTIDALYRIACCRPRVRPDWDIVVATHSTDLEECIAHLLKVRDNRIVPLLCVAMSLSSFAPAEVCRVRLQMCHLHLLQAFCRLADYGVGVGTHCVAK
jgi:hypothetical protein